MSLRDLVDRKSQIEAGGETFEVRGLSLEDIVLLLDNHKDALTSIFAKTAGADFAELVKEFPGFVAAAIAYAADEHDMEEEVRKLPVGTQLKAIAAVWELSNLDVETVGNLAAGVVEGLAKLNDTSLQTLTAPLMSGSEVSPQLQSSSSQTDTPTRKSSGTRSGG